MFIDGFNVYLVYSLTPHPLQKLFMTPVIISVAAASIAGTYNDTQVFAGVFHRWVHWYQDSN